jgi:hypothetical protein
LHFPFRFTRRPFLLNRFLTTAFYAPRIKIIARLIAHQNEYRSEVEIPTARRSSTSAQRRRLSSRAGANDFSITGKKVCYGKRLLKVLA